MIYFITAFALLGSLSLLLMFAALTQQRLRCTSFCKRAALLAFLWLTAAGGLHTLLTTSASFRQGLPAGLLNLDLKFAWYGRVALPELTRRAENAATGRADWSKTSRRLFANPWWVNDTDGEIPAPGGYLIHPARSWFRHLLLVEELSADDFQRWLKIDPAPIFTAPDEIKPAGPGLTVTARFGREWNAQTKIPYEISKLEITAVQIAGSAVEFKLVEAENSTAELGRYAPRVIWRIENLPQPTGVTEFSIEIEYHLWAEPGRFKKIGPLRWGKIIRVRQ